MLPDADDVHRLPDPAKDVVAELCHKLYGNVEALKRSWEHALHYSEKVAQQVPTESLRYYRNHVAPDEKVIETVLRTLRPELFEFFEFWSEFVSAQLLHGKIHRTFEVALERMHDLVRDFPELEKEFALESADEVVSSDLIDFDPDDWTRNTRRLRPVMVGKRTDCIPAHIRLRLIEMHRTLTFGNWISAAVLARSILEYAILDNAARWNISLTWDVTIQSRRERKRKSLEDLVDAVAEQIPRLKEEMHYIREEGNAFAHPTRERVSKERLFSRRDVAFECYEKLVGILEDVYLPDDMT